MNDFLVTFFWALGTLVVLAASMTAYWMLYERMADSLRLRWQTRNLPHHMHLSDQQAGKLITTVDVQSRIPLGPPATAKRHTLNPDVHAWCEANEVKARIIPPRTWKAKPHTIAFGSDTEAMAFLMQWG